MNAIEKAKDIIAKGEKLNSPLYDTALVLDFREAANPAALLPLLRLLVECEEVLATRHVTLPAALELKIDALLAKLRRKS